MRVGGCVSEKAELLFIDVILAIDADIDVIALVPVSVPKHVSGIRPILFRRLGVRRGLGRTLARRGRAELELLIIEFFIWFTFSLYSTDRPPVRPPQQRNCLLFNATLLH